MSDQLWFIGIIWLYGTYLLGQKNHGGDQKEKLKKLKTFKNTKKTEKIKQKNQKFEITKECIKNIKNNQKHSHTKELPVQFITIIWTEVLFRVKTRNIKNKNDNMCT